MRHKIGAALILLGVLCVLAAFCIDAKKAPDREISGPVLFYKIQTLF